MKPVISILRGTGQLLVLLALSVALTQASTISYYIDIFGNPGGTAVAGTPNLGGSPLHPVPPPPGSTITQGTGTSAAVNIPAFVETIPGDPTHINVLTSVQFLVYMAATANVHAVNTDPNAAHGFTSITGTTSLTVSEIGGAGVAITQSVSAGVAPSTPCIASTDGTTSGPTTFACDPTIPPGAVGAVDKEKATTTTTYSYGTGFPFTGPGNFCVAFGGTIVTNPPSQPPGTYCQYNPNTTTTYAAITNYYTGSTAYADNHLAPTSVTTGLGAFEGATPSNLQFNATDNGTTVNGNEQGGDRKSVV